MNEILKTVAEYSGHSPRVTTIKPDYYSKPPQITVCLEDGEEIKHPFQNFDSESFKRQWRQARTYWEQVKWIDD